MVLASRSVGAEVSLWLSSLGRGVAHWGAGHRTADGHDTDMLSFRFKGGKQAHDGVLIKHGVPSRPHAQVADQVR